MGAKQHTLAALLATVGTVTKRAVRHPRHDDLARSDLAAEVKRVYQALGGCLPEFPLNIRSWDIEFEGHAVELDEQLHFNRYRALTLESELYSRLPAFPLIAYRDYCFEFEDECLRAGSYGGKWTNPSCEKQFGAAGAPKDLAGAGAPRWKQRAFYDS